MSTTLPETPLRKVIRHELQAIRGKWLWLVVLGIALIVLGTILLGSPVIATLATVTVLGSLILVGRRTRDGTGSETHLSLSV
jgi:uncharacterized membrane protein HdeD (DUF308 family)